MPIRKLLVSIHESFSGYLIYFHYNFFDRAKETNMYQTKSLRLRSQKVVIFDVEMDGIDTDDTGNLEDLLRVVFINEASGNLTVVIGSGELTRNIHKKKKFEFLQSYRCTLCDKCSRREHFFNKQVEYCKSIQ